MGNLESTFLKVCGSALKRQKLNPQIKEKDEENSNFIIRNKDGYFQKDDFNKITMKFPEYKDWPEQNSSPSSSKDKKKHKTIKWKQGEIIGHGSYGKVIMGLNIETGCMMAVKQVQIGGVNTSAQQDRIKALEVEIDILSQFSHKNIVSYYGSERNKDTFNIFLEYISGGTIASLLDKYGPFNENLIRVYTRQILQGLEYLHVRNTMHRDIKGANVLVDNSGVCKLTDFGTAKRISALVEGESKYLPSIKGTINWMAPEVIKQSTLGRYCDIWSVGCTVIEMATGKAPWSSVLKADANYVSLLYQIAQAKSPPPIPKELSNEAVDFLKQCFKINPQERPNVIKLLNHKFISGVEIFYKHLEVPHEKSKTKSLSPNDKNQNKNKNKNKSIPITQPVLKESHSHSVPDIFGQNENKDLFNNEYTRYSKPPVHTKPSSSIYDFQISFPIPDSKSNLSSQPSTKETKEDKTGRKASDGSIGPLMSSSRKDSLSKDLANTEDELKYTQIPSLKTISQSSKTEIDSLTVIKNLSEGTPKESATKYEITKPHFEIRTKAPARPLGKNNKRFPPTKGYTNLSFDESISGASFMMAGSPGTIPEIGDDKSSNPSTGKLNTGNYLSVPNGLQGRVFQFPESITQLEEQERQENNNKDWDLTRHDKIDEEEEKDDTESEYGKEKIVLSDSGHMEKEDHGNQSEIKSLNNLQENNENSRVSCHSNPEMFSIEIEDNLDNISKKGKGSKESSALFKHDYVARNSEKRNSLMSMKDDESFGKLDAPLQLHHIAPDYMENKAEDGETVENLGVIRMNSSPRMKKTTGKQNGYYNNRSKYEMKENRECVDEEKRSAGLKGKGACNEVKSAGSTKKKYILSDENEKTVKFQFVP